MINDLPLTMVRCLAETILIECGLAFLIGIREKKDLLNVLLVNIMTNPVLVVSFFIVNLRFGYHPAKIYEYCAEAAVVIIEGLVYRKVLNYRKFHSVLVSLVLNFASFSLGEVINMILY